MKQILNMLVLVLLVAIGCQQPQQEQGTVSIDFDAIKKGAQTTPVTPTAPTKHVQPYTGKYDCMYEIISRKLRGKKNVHYWQYKNSKQAFFIEEVWVKDPNTNSWKFLRGSSNVVPWIKNNSRYIVKVSDLGGWYSSRIGEFFDDYDCAYITFNSQLGFNGLDSSPPQCLKDSEQSFISVHRRIFGY